MSYDFHLYRAATGLEGMHAWDEDERQPLGDAHTVRARIAARFPALSWAQDRHGDWRASGGDEDGAPREVRIPSEADGPVLAVIAYAGPPELRALMQAIDANYCYAPEEMGLRDPFGCGDDW